ncbi:polyprotein [Plakobranchus ocellatus]|uniref:Polyprotein n=1 Tax=Plakobranchus ocellatus TaxID=259542 RepID=A0AAV3YJS4_9GAST|nr:polyprotein [Plakobranchus ocellatus]
MSDIKTKKFRLADEFLLSGGESPAQGLGKVKVQRQPQVKVESFRSAEDLFDNDPTLSGKNEVDMQSMFVTNQQLIDALRDRVEKLERKKKRSLVILLIFGGLHLIGGNKTCTNKMS